MSYALSRMLGSRFRVLVALIALLLPAGLAYLWYEAGGIPRNHDRYGFVGIRSGKRVELPAGQVRLYFQAPADSKSGSTDLPPVPDGLRANIRPAIDSSGVTAPSSDGRLEQQSVPSWLFSSSANGVGWKPIGKVEVPTAGEYEVDVTDDDGPAATAPPPANSTADRTGLGSPGNTAPPAGISLGEAPWTPFGSALVGAVLVFVLFAGLFAGIAAIATAGRRILEEGQRERS